MTGRYGKLDYPRLTKTGFAFGVALFAFGVLGHFVGNAFFAPLPGWESVLLTDLEILGILVAFFSPIVFGILLPLTE
ncbi:hypothetical protein SAMN04487950_3149 [Halogranum rubrum]|uniref:Uncharacterized protein n=2 Tax=Halogranum rubrum TaxID=553466 RepID=A0A1I4GCU7_9EURY|nr:MULTISPECIES: hypothetical protein [Halogranum]EJN59684.1 hypothetical protein HSB1_18420 [Halogranum salarium B-1]SFL26981.1 hypothetical protein SAMN04487950_3149 [Halogranum rubrum]